MSTTGKMNKEKKESIIKNALEHSMCNARKIAERIKSLYGMSQEEFPDQIPLSPQSVNSLRVFITQNKNFINPELVVTPEGNIRASWTRSSNKHFAIDFLPEGGVRFVIFSPGKRRSYNKIIRISGISTIDSILDHVEALGLGIFDWIYINANKS